MAFLALLVCSFAPQVSFAATWPRKPITIVVPFAAGGSTDLAARFLGTELEKKLGVRVIIKNVAGATGSVGAAEVASSKPDGYTLGFFTPGPAVGIPNTRRLPYGRNSWECVCMTFDLPVFIAIAKDSPWDSLDIMVADIKANPGKYIYASTGIGGATYLSMKGFLRALDLDLRHVPERSSADAFKAIAGGTTQMYSAIAPEMQRFDVKSFVYISEKRSPLLADVPTVKELGINAPIITNWQGVFVAKGTPKEIVQKLSDTIGEICADPEFAAAGARMDMPVDFRPTEEFTKFYFEQFDIYADLLAEDIRNN